MPRMRSARSRESFGVAGSSSSWTTTLRTNPCSIVSSTSSRRSATRPTAGITPSAVRVVPTVTAAQMAEVDRISVENLQIPVDLLMENASRQIAVAARAFLGGAVAGKRVVGLVGTGNNGGDAAGALRHLLNWGARVHAEFIGAEARVRETVRPQAILPRLAATSQVAIVHD